MHHFILAATDRQLAQNADAVIDRSEILIGEQATIKLSYRIQKSGAAKVVFPVIGDTLLANVEVISQSEVDTLRTGEGVAERRLEQLIVITSFDTGYYAIPPFELKVDGDIEKTPAFLLTVKTVEIDTTQGIMADNPILEVDVTLADYVKIYWPYAAAAAATIILIAAAFILFFYMKRKRARRPTAPPAEPAIPADTEALNALRRMKEERIYLKGRVKEYHTGISDAMRTYIERVFGIQAHELTSAQILSALRYSELGTKNTALLRIILLQADMVKFAKEIPTETENEKAVADALNFVRDTAHFIEPKKPEQDEQA